VLERRIPRWGRTDRPDFDSAFNEPITDWNNSMAAGMMPLDQEVAAFAGGDVMPLSTPGNNNGLNHRN